MNTLLIFFALPIATIILAVVLQKILRNPLLVAATFFAIYLVITFAFFDASFLVYAILYTILAYVTATLTNWICRLIRLTTNQHNGDCNATERPITINNTNPTNSSINLTGDATLLTSGDSTNTAGNSNGNSNGNCCCRRRLRY